MVQESYFRLQFIVFALVAAAYTNMYVVQPVLPIMQAEFAVDIVTISFATSFVILGMALSNMPAGLLADRLPMQPIILIGGTLVAVAGLVCAVTENLVVLIGARFVQGVFTPPLTACLAAYLAKTLPKSRINIVLGSYVSATVFGGMSGRLIGGWVHTAFHWRYAFVVTSTLTLITTAIAFWELPKAESRIEQQPDSTSFLQILKRWDLMRLFICTAGVYAIFSSIFNYLPYRLGAPPFGLSTEITTLLYLVYVAGIFIGPIAGRLNNSFGTGNVIIAGSFMFGTSLTLMLLPSITSFIVGLLGICIGFFAIHATAVGALNHKLSSGQGRANALYILFYYVGGWLGITASGFAYEQSGWNVFIYLCMAILIIPLAVGFGERTSNKC